MKDNEVVIEQFTLESRKVELSYIRKKWIEKHENFMRCFSPEYETRDPEFMIQYLKDCGEFEVGDAEDIDKFLEKYRRYFN